MTKQEERLKEFVISVTYGGRGYDLDDTLPVSEFEKKLKAFIQSEIDLALANKNKEIVEKIEVWLPCEQGEGTAIKNDGSQMKLIAMVVGSKIIHLEKNAYIEMTKLSKEEADNYKSIITKDNE